jgi:hypothetical protein
MKLDDPLTVLDKLDEEKYLLVHHTSGSETSEEQDLLHKDMRNAFGMALDRLATQWGEPNFLGGWDHPDFPDWYDAILMATWKHPEGTAYLGYQWSGPEVPMLIVLGRRKE